MLKKHEMISKDSVRIPKIHTIGYSDDRKITFFGPSVRNQYIIHYVLSGKGYFNGKLVEKGQGFLITPGLYEEYFSDEREPWTFLWIISEDSAMEYFFEMHGADPKTGIFNFHNLYEFNSICDTLQEGYNVFSSSASLAQMFLHIYNRCVVGENRKATSLTKDYFDFSVNYIKSNLHLGVKVDDLCRAVGITQPYLYKIFIKYAGCSPKRFISSIKLSESKKLLKNSSLSISQISNSLGFVSVMDFSKFFAKETGFSPSDYKNI